MTATPAAPLEVDTSHGVVLYLEDVTVSFDGFKALNALTLYVNVGELRCVIGPNGAGKTTLFRMIMGEEKPDAGELRIGETVVLSYVDQSREKLVGERSVWEEISDGGKDLVMVGKREVNSRAYAASFGFRGPDQQKKVKDLSGGERNRVHLAKLLKQGANLLKTKGDIEHDVRVLLGGMANEELFFGEEGTTNGAHNDITRVTQLVRTQDEPRGATVGHRDREASAHLLLIAQRISRGHEGLKRQTELP